MTIESVCRIKGGRQDGAVCNGFMFSFDHAGECTVYRMEDIENAKKGEAEIFAGFLLDRCDILVPHSNSVMFGNEYFDENDEFPLLYTNIYNNYVSAEDKLKGVCLVYRLKRNGNVFSSELVQMIEVGFVENEALWKSAGKKGDVRPYGNFVIDTEKDLLYAFTMRDGTCSTRYFAFPMPKVSDGVLCEKYGVKKVVLGTEDIIRRFDCDYHRFIQGACCHGGKIYSLEGFSDSLENPPAIRVIDADLGEQVLYKKFGDLGTTVEPELIDFDGDICYYSDDNGNVYRINFEG